MVPAVIRRRPTLVLDNGQTPDDWEWKYKHTGAMMVVTWKKDGRQVQLLDKETLTLTGTAYDLRKCRKDLDEYLAQR